MVDKRAAGFTAPYLKLPPGVQMFKPKAGVMLLELQPVSRHQGELDFGGEPDQEAVKGRLATALDAINTRFGRGSVGLASRGLEGDRRTWTMKQQRRTPAYTTRWEDMPVVRA